MFKHYTRKYKGSTLRVGNKITADRTTTVAGFSERSNVLHDVKKLSTDKTFSETARQEWQSIIRT